MEHDLKPHQDPRTDCDDCEGINVTVEPWEKKVVLNTRRQTSVSSEKKAYKISRKQGDCVAQY